MGAYELHGDAKRAPQVRLLKDEAEAVALADVVVIATPVEAHASAVRYALEAGRHVLVEKPLCATASEAKSLAAAAIPPVRLFVGHSERFNPVVRALGRLLRGERICSIDVHRAGPTRACGGGVLLNLGVHDFDLAAYLAGRLTLRSSVGGEDFAHVLFETSSGTVGHLYLDRTAPHKSRAITVTTPRWTYEGDLLDPRLSRTARHTGVRTDVPLPLGEPLAAQALALADALDGAPSREIATGADGAFSVELAETALAQCTSAPSAENLSRIARP